MFVPKKLMSLISYIFIFSFNFIYFHKYWSKKLVSVPKYVGFCTGIICNIFIVFTSFNVFADRMALVLHGGCCCNDCSVSSAFGHGHSHGNGDHSHGNGGHSHGGHSHSHCSDVNSESEDDSFLHATNHGHSHSDHSHSHTNQYHKLTPVDSSLSVGVSNNIHSHNQAASDSSKTRRNRYVESREDYQLLPNIDEDEDVTSDDFAADELLRRQATVHLAYSVSCDLVSFSASSPPGDEQVNAMELYSIPRICATPSVPSLNTSVVPFNASLTLGTYQSINSFSGECDRRPLTGTSRNRRKHFEENNINVRAAMVHVIGDLFQSIGVLIAAIVIKTRVCLISVSFTHVILTGDA